jgi:nucleotide-binding universal stress UspA family protein
MVKTLIVPVDGGESSLRALAVAAAFAKAIGVSVTALTVADPAMGAFRDEAWLKLYATSPLVPIEPVVILSEHTVETLLEAAEPDGAMLCMSSHGRTGAGEVLFGSVSARVVRDSTKPVLLVGPEALPPEAFDTVAICVSGDESSMEAVAAGEQWVSALDATPWLVTVVTGADSFLPDTAERRVVDLAMERMAERGFHPRKLVLCERDRAAAVIHLAQWERCCMIVTGARPRDGIERLALGSMSRELVRCAPLPVLVVGPSVPTSDG